jgi:hypothetical protein
VSLSGRSREAALGVATGVTDAWWSIPLGVYRLSGRRLAGSPQLYRAGVLRQQLQRDRLPGMTASTERAYFTWQTRELFTGRGTIVDLGSWFGSTTTTLAAGLAANPRPSTREAVIHAYDRFVWEGWMDDYAAMAVHGPYAEGESFVREFERIVAPWRDRIHLHAGDLCEEVWPGDPIEVLLVDAMKAWDVTYHILSQFYGSLVSDAYVIHQDFSNCFTPWIHLVSYRYREHLVPVLDVPRAETMVFRVARPFDGSAELGLTRDDFDGDEVEAAFEHSLRVTGREKHSGIRAARLIALVYDDDLASAQQRLRADVAAGRLNPFHAQAVRGAIERATAETAHDRRP